MELDKSYSADVEIDHNGNVVWAREICDGEVVAIPVHMWERLCQQSHERQMKQGPRIT